MLTPNAADWTTLLPPDLPTPCFVVDEARLAANLAVLDSVQQRTGAKILLALKGFAMFSTFPLLRRALHGVCASSPHEARLGREAFQREVHVFAAAYSEEDIRDIARYADHVLFNSLAQLRRFGPQLRRMTTGAGHAFELGLRLNPEHSEGATPLYDPCAPGSRLGIREAALADVDAAALQAEGVSGLHFHTLCEQDAAPLARTLAVVERRFGRLFPGMRWLNFGGGHHITRPGYDIDLLCRCIHQVRERYGLEVYLEPGEAVALNAGVLASRVLDVVEADMPVVILDASAAAHMPDVLEMPYRPGVVGADQPGVKTWTCRLAGKSCLAGDVVGEYSFDRPLAVGDRLLFLDMAHYSMVKTTTFNGLGLPGIALIDQHSRRLRLIRQFGYEDFRSRLS
jgi:carboxynorspermidine decarboxylase